MEVLSTGEKIKRARIYKGITLKDICGDKVSISKMSCIENDKIQAEPWILEIISQKLDLSIEYLKKDVKSQIRDNLDNLKDKDLSEEIEKELRYNLDYALHSKEYKLAFEILHILFEKYMKCLRYDDLEDIISDYYDICQKNNDWNCSIIYYNDMAFYFYINREYIQAASYYENVINIVKSNIKNDYEVQGLAKYNRLKCYVDIKEYDVLAKEKDDVLDTISKVKDAVVKAGLYNIAAVNALSTGDIEEAEKLQLLSIEYYGDNEEVIHSRNVYAQALMNFEKSNESFKYMEETIELSKKKFPESLGSILSINVESLYKKEMFSKAEVRCNEMLDFAISSQDIRMIEKGYCYKARILKKRGANLEAEMCMNLSLDALRKFANTKELYDRYIEMAAMYHDFGEVRDALRYFNLSFNLKKII